MLILDIPNVKLARLNNKYMLSRNRLILTPAYRDFKNYIIASVIPFRNKIKFPVYSMFINLITHLDIDSSIKVIIDGVFEGLQENDSNLHYLVVDKKSCKRNEPNSLKVYLQEWKNED
jgi:hypothetical protein